MKRVALFQDLSGFGRAALATAMPVFGALGIQPCAIPTALLSTHTLYPNAVVREESAFLLRAIEHWTKLDLAFDAVYSGYLAEPAQAEGIAAFGRAQAQKHRARVVVDPVMADHGRLYRGLSPDMPSAMRALCQGAYLITPNPTEARLLTGRDPAEGSFDDASLRALLRDLLALGCEHALVTGVSRADGRVGNCLATKASARFCPYAPLPKAFPGTGDLFASVLTGKLLLGASPDEAMGCATAFVYRAMEETIRADSPVCEGVRFEPLLSSVSDRSNFTTQPLF